jgi:DNA-binding CsgD family transcriptional regulator
MRSIGAALAAPDVSGILVSGPAGVGKSRLAREALSLAASNGRDVRWTAGTSSAQAVPLGAFTAWAPPAFSESVQLLRGVIESLTATDNPPVILAVDDAHLLDDLSTFVVQQIVARGAAKAVLTIRDDGQIRPGTREIWSSGRFERLDVRHLSLDGTTELLAKVLRGRIDPTAAQRLWSLTDGNVLYLRNIVEQEVADGRIAEVNGYWRWTGDPAMPPGLVELIEARMGALTKPVNDVIDTLAVGEPMDLAALTHLTDANAIEDAETRGLITVERAGEGVEVRIAHPLYGEVRRRRAAKSRLRRLRGLVATELAAARDCDDSSVVVRRATLCLDSDLAPDADLLVRGAYGAVWLGDLALADRLADAAIHAGAGPEPRLVRAHALSWLGRGAEAEAVFVRIDTTELSERDRARFAFLRASNALWALGDPDRAKEIVDDAAQAASPDARTYVDAFRTVHAFATDRPESALQASKSVALEDIPVVGAEVAWALTQVWADAGRTAEAVTSAEAGYAVATRTLDAPHMRFNIADAHVSALQLAGLSTDALDVAEHTRALASDLPGDAQLLGAAVAGRAALGVGRVNEACQLLARAVVGLAETHAGGWGYRYRIALATALAMRGSTDDAAAELSELGKVRRRFRSLDHELSLARAWLAASQGAVSDAAGILRAAAERASEVGRFAAETMCLQTAVQFGDRTCAQRLKELEPIVEGPRAPAAARFAAALAESDGPELSSVSEEFERNGDLVAAIDAASHAALTFRRDDKRGSALVCVARAEALAEQCGGISTPTLRHASEPLPLTEREVEIVMLIGEGLSNREIAERLTLSVRTVESHIYRAMAKTGVTSREQLAALLPK